MNNSPRWFVVALLLAAVGSQFLACASRAEVRRADVQDVVAPHSVAERHLNAMLAGDWEVSVALTNPEEVARVARAFREVWAADTTGFTAQRVLGIAQDVNPATLSDQEVAARLFAFQVGVSARGSAFDRFTGVEIVGVARPWPDTAYVIYNWLLPAAERPIRSQNVVKLERAAGQWWLHMLSDFEQLRQTLLSSVRR